MVSEETGEAVAAFPSGLFGHLEELPGDKREEEMPSLPKRFMLERICTESIRCLEASTRNAFAKSSVVRLNSSTSNPLAITRCRSIQRV